MDSPLPSNERFAGLGCRDWESCPCTPCAALREIKRLEQREYELHGINIDLSRATLEWKARAEAAEARLSPEPGPCPHCDSYCHCSNPVESADSDLVCGSCGAPFHTSSTQPPLASHWLGELLAVIHGDGGHYEAKHGIEQASKDAIAKISALKVDLDRATQPPGADARDGVIDAARLLLVAMSPIDWTYVFCAPGNRPESAKTITAAVRDLESAIQTWRASETKISEQPRRCAQKAALTNGAMSMNDVVGRIEQLTETAKLGVSIGGPAGAAMVVADKYDKRIAELEAKLRRCREIMECNDPINARDIFGPPTQGKEVNHE